MIDVLRRVSLFSGLKDQHLKYLADTAVRHRYPKDSILFFEGDYSDSLYIVVHGRLKAIVSDNSGKEITLSIMGAGEYFGEVSLFDREPRSATIVAIDDTQVLMISNQYFRNVLAKNTDMAYDIIKVLIKRLRRATDNIQSLAFMDVHSRMVNYLKKIAEPHGDLLIIKERLTHKEIAGLINCSREMVSRVMRNLISGGWLVCKDDLMTLKKNTPNSV